MKKKDGTDEVKTIDELTDHKLIDLMKTVSQTRKKLVKVYITLHNYCWSL